MSYTTQGANVTTTIEVHPDGFSIPSTGELLEPHDHDPLSARSTIYMLSESYPDAVWTGSPTPLFSDHVQADSRTYAPLPGWYVVVQLDESSDLYVGPYSALSDAAACFDVYPQQPNEQLEWIA